MVATSSGRFVRSGTGKNDRGRHQKELSVMCAAYSTGVNGGAGKEQYHGKTEKTTCRPFQSVYCKMQLNKTGLDIR